MWSDLVNSPGKVEAWVDLGRNEGKMISNGDKKGAIGFSSGKGVISKVVYFLNNF